MVDDPIQVLPALQPGDEPLGLMAQDHDGPVGPARLEGSDLVFDQGAALPREQRLQFSHTARFAGRQQHCPDASH